MLDLWEGPQPSNALLSRVLADAATVTSDTQAAPAAPRPQPQRQGWVARLIGNASLVRPGLALAACLALGFVMGTGIEDTVLTPATQIETAEQLDVIDFAFAMEDDADLLLGPEALL